MDRALPLWNREENTGDILISETTNIFLHILRLGNKGEAYLLHIGSPYQTHKNKI